MKKQEEKQLDFFVEFSLRSNSWLITTGQVALPHPFGKKNWETEKKMYTTFPRMLHTSTDPNQLVKNKHNDYLLVCTTHVF